MAWLDETGLSHFLDKLKTYFLPLSGGDLSGVVEVTRDLDQGAIRRTAKTGYLIFCGGSTATNGAVLSLSGGTRSGNEGLFRLSARTSSSNIKNLDGKPDGTLTWDGSSILTEANTAPAEVTLTDAGYMDFTTLKAWRSGNVVQVYLYFKIPATAPTSWTTIATGLPAPMMQIKTCAATWTASYARPVALSVETDGSIKAIYGKASNNYGITFSYVTAD